MRWYLSDIFFVQNNANPADSIGNFRITITLICLILISYESKTAYYRKQGVDRRGQQDAHKALCNLYTKIIGINLTDDTYKVINMDINEQTKEKGFADKISEWFTSFGETGQVHPDDLEEYLRLTDLEYLREYFKGDKSSLSLIYRRKYNDGFRKVMMEIIPANDYSDDYQSLFLYVKEIDRNKND